MTILYGKSLWEAVDAVGRWMLERLDGGPGELSPTGWFLFFDLGYYAVAGWLAGAIPDEIAQALKHPWPVSPGWAQGAEAPPSLAPSRKACWRRAPFRAGVAMAGLLGVLMWLHPGQAGWIRGLRVFARALVVLGIWMWVVRPMALALFRWFRRREQGVYGAEVFRALEQFTALRRAAAAAWRGSAEVGGWRRGKHFLVALVMLALAGDSAGRGSKG